MVRRLSHFIFPGGRLFDDTHRGMPIYREEIFGPVLCVVRTDTYEEALRLMNDHESGNGAAIFTRDGDTARDFASRQCERPTTAGICMQYTAGAIANG
jgi:malonate-semialdehyde dehydrogenase (acetylating)/methylmalonate-semialdehyde dehydrogenase